MTDAGDSGFVDRALGAFLGLAIGDALGTTIEFAPRDSYAPVTAMVGGGPFRLRPGQWTDDTAMAVCLAESLLHDRHLDAGDLMDRFSRWAWEGENSSTGSCFDIGQTTLQAIGTYRRSGNPFAGPLAPMTAGNGSIMRLAPVVLAWARDPAEAERVAVEQGRTTHGADECGQACVLLARILLAALHGAPKHEVLTPRIGSDWSPGIRAIIETKQSGRARSSIRSTGYVVHTLDAAVWAVSNTATFREAVLLGVNLGEDADTVGAVTGQIAGAVYGASGIDADLLAPLWDRARLEALGRALINPDLGEDSGNVGVD